MSRKHAGWALPADLWQEPKRRRVKPAPAWSRQHVVLAVLLEETRLLGRLAPALALLMPSLGCELPPGGVSPEPAPTPVVPKLHAAHPDVQFQGSLTLADFQSPEQVRQFRVVGPDPVLEDLIRPTITTLPDDAGSPERVLAASLADTGHVLLLDVSALRPPSRTGDWRDFGVLLLSVRAPPEGAGLIMSVASGAPDAPPCMQPMRLDAGWNHLRIDLTEIRRHLDLADVHTLGWRLSPGGGPAGLHFDDLVLADRVEWLVGKDAAAGELYAFSHGQRVFVGARGRFELGFADGVIVAWHADSPDNLTVSAGLGPWPVALPPTRSGNSKVPSAPHGLTAAAVERSPAAESGQRVLEASACRVVVATSRIDQRRPAGSEPATTAPSAEERTWRYVVYPDGRLFVRTTWAPHGPGEPASPWGHTVVLAGRNGFRSVPTPPARPDQEPAEFVLASRAEANRADLFWTCAVPAAIAHRRVIQRNQRQPLVLLAGRLPAGESMVTAHLLRLWPPDLDSAAKAERLAADYQNPVALRPGAGRLVTDAPGDLNHDGYNESEGCYELALHRGMARFDFDPGRWLRESPVFRIHGIRGRSCWVYADGQALPAGQRDADGRLLFTLPGTIRTPRTIEVYTLPAPASSR